MITSVNEHRTGSLRIPISRAFLVSIVLIVAVIRVFLLRWPGQGFDEWVYQHWTWRLVYEPLSRFYVDDGAAFPDHLPGDLWLLRGIGRTLTLADPHLSFYSTAMTDALALAATLFDILLATTLWRVGLATGRPRLGIAAALAWWAAPASIMVSSVWRQIDSVSAAIAIVSLALALSRRYSLACLALTLCVLIKPQYALLALPILVGWNRQRTETGAAWWWRVSATGVICATLAAGIIAPFGVSLVGGYGKWTLLDRVQAANGLYPVSTLGAHNLWIMPIPFATPPDDRVAWVLGFGRSDIGKAAMLSIVVYACWLLIARWRGPITMVVASNLLVFGFFLVMTRMHERYLYPVAALSLLLAVMDARYWRYASAVQTVVFVNIATRFYWTLQDGAAGPTNLWYLQSLEHTWLVEFAVIATVLIFVWLMWDPQRPPRHRHSVSTRHAGGDL